MNDFSLFDRNNRIYTGSEEKFGITINSEHFLLKFQKKSETGFLNNHISEHLGSTIFNLIGEDAQITSLGVCQGRPVVACKDFNSESEVFTPFNGVGESSLERDKELYQYTYDDISEMLRENVKITNVSEIIRKFWNMYLIDALLGNFDRHGANWGFLKKDNNYRMAPIFDNGSSLFPRRNSDELMREPMMNEEVLNQMTYKYPTSQIRIGRRKTSYFDIINSLEFPDCNEALLRVYPRIRLSQIFKLIEIEDILTDLQKRFYQFIIQQRFEKIIKNSYQKLMGGKPSWNK